VKENEPILSDFEPPSLRESLFLGKLRLVLAKQTLQVNVSSCRERTNLTFPGKTLVLGTRLIGISVITTKADEFELLKQDRDILGSTILASVI
jgi:hypothetical protein